MATNGNLRQLCDEFGLDVVEAVQSAFNLGSHVGEGEWAERYRALVEMTDDERVADLVAENDTVRRDAERIFAINRHVIALLMEEHHFINRGWLRRCLVAARKANDRRLVARLVKLHRDLGLGGQRGFQGKRGRPRKGKHQ